MSDRPSGERARTVRQRAFPGPLAADRRRPPRAEITAAAARFFAEHGYHTVGMREIAEAVGMRGASLYNHFSSKEEVLYAIALGHDEGAGRGAPSAARRRGHSGTRLAALLRAHIRHLAGHRVEHLVGLRELPALTPEHRAGDHRPPPVLPAPGAGRDRRRGASGEFAVDRTPPGRGGDPRHGQRPEQLVPPRRRAVAPRRGRRLRGSHRGAHAGWLCAEIATTSAHGCRRRGPGGRPRAGPGGHRGSVPRPARTHCSSARTGTGA